MVIHTFIHTFDSTNQIASNPPAQKKVLFGVQRSIVAISLYKKIELPAGEKIAVPYIKKRGKQETNRSRRALEMRETCATVSFAIPFTNFNK
jgi:hypothetical protein